MSHWTTIVTTTSHIGLLLLLISSLLHICQIGLLLHLCLRDEKGASAVVCAHLCSVVDHFVSWYSGDGDDSLVIIVLLMTNLVVIFDKNTDWIVLLFDPVCIKAISPFYMIIS